MPGSVVGAEEVWEGTREVPVEQHEHGREHGHDHRHGYGHEHGHGHGHGHGGGDGNGHGSGTGSGDDEGGDGSGDGSGTENGDGKVHGRNADAANAHVDPANANADPTNANADANADAHALLPDYGVTRQGFTRRGVEEMFVRAGLVDVKTRLMRTELELPPSWPGGLTRRMFWVVGRKPASSGG